VLVSGLAHLVAFKRIANRITDRADLEELERIHRYRGLRCPASTIDRSNDQPGARCLVEVDGCGTVAAHSDRVHARLPDRAPQ
jgi:hypothetical protein